MTRDADEQARRTRAALAYKGIDVKTGVEGISPATMARIVSSTKPRGWKAGEVEKLAAATEVPLSFFADGFTPDDPTILERLEALEGHMTTVLKLTGGRGTAPVPGALGPELRDRSTTDEGRPRRSSGPGPGADAGSGRS